MIFRPINKQIIIDYFAEQGIPNMQYFKKYELLNLIYDCNLQWDLLNYSLKNRLYNQIKNTLNKQELQTLINLENIFKN